MKPPLVASLCIQLHGVSSKLRIANIMVLAAELEYLHKELNYHIKGVPLKADAGRKKVTWAAFCKEQAGVTDVTAKTYLEGWDALKFRLHYDTKPSSKLLLELMAQRPSCLEDDVRKGMIDRIASHVLRDEDTPGSLRKEYREPRAIKADVSLHTVPDEATRSNDTDLEVAPADESADEMELLALACGVSKQMAKKVSLVIQAKNYVSAAADLGGQSERADPLN